MRKPLPSAGMSALGVIFTIAVLAVIVLLAFKTVPVYLEYFNVASSVNSLREDPDLVRRGKAEIRERLMRRLQINDVTRVKREHIHISRYQDGIRINVAYEVRVPLVGNVDLLFTFNKTLDIRQ